MAPQSYQLVMRSGPNPGKVYPLENNEIYIGRDVNNDVVISDSEVSRKHARMVMQAGGFVLEDLGSTNGTFVNGQRLMGPHMLRPGELIMLGENVSLTFEAGFDPDATIATTSTSREGPADVFPQPEPREPAGPPPVQAYSAPQLQPTYSGQIPQGPPETYYEPAPTAEERSRRRWIYAGCGCLLVLGCLILVAAYAFDSLNLYCTPPFNTLFPCP